MPANIDDSKRQRLDRPRHQARYNDYHELTMSIYDIYHEISNRNYLKRPDSIRGNLARRN